MTDATVQNEPDTRAAAMPPTPQPASAPEADTRGFGDAVFNESITVSTSIRIPHYDKGPVRAYAARGTDKAPANLFALICDDALSPRTSKVSNYISILNPSMPRLVASGIISWAPSGKEKYCFIYEDILGAPLMRDDTRGGAGMKPDRVLASVIRPMISVLQDMHDRDIVHGNIRPSNIFSSGASSLERAALGECLALPIGYNQPALYEPINRALCSPLGRGTGTQKDDLYSFGVSLALLMRHNDPTEGMNDEEIIESKMAEGTYTTLLGRDRFSGAILELLRGLLYDDENQRWGLEDILVWLDGRRLSPKQAARRLKAARPLHFNGEKYIRPEFLARDLNKNISEARKLIDGGDMEQWLARALEDKAVTARFEKALKYAEEGGKDASGYAEQVVARTAIALHPEGPIRYRTINLYPDGVGAALTEAYIMKRDVQSYVDFFMVYFVTQWIEAQSGPVLNSSEIIAKFDSARAYLRQKGLGFGIEKCLYILNPEIHCLSEKLQKFHVRTPEDMMHAFEKLSRNPGRPIMFFDRHIISFLSVKDRKNIDPYMHELNAPESYKRNLAEMKTLATIQKRSRMPNFPGIASWVAENLKDAYERFHDRELRESIRKLVEKYKDGGDLGKIIALFDNPATYQNDFQDFRRAMRDYFDMEQECEDINRQLVNEKSYGLETGRKVAVMVAGVISGIIIAATAFSSFSGGGIM